MKNYMDMTIRELMELEDFTDLLEVGLVSWSEVEENYALGIEELLDSDDEDDVEFAEDYLDMGQHDREEVAAEEIDAETMLDYANNAFKELAKMLYDNFEKNADL